MTPSITAARMTGSAHRAELPLLVLGPSLDTSAMTTWSACATDLTEGFDVVAWDLPGQGHNRSVPQEPFTLAELASGVLAVVDDILEQREDAGGRFFYAGDSVGGEVGLRLLLDAPGRVAAAVVLGASAPADLAVPVLELSGASYLDPVESPGEVARLLRQHFLGDLVQDRTSPDSTGSTDFARDLAMTVRDAIANGVSAEEVRQLLLETAAQYDRPGRPS